MRKIFLLTALLPCIVILGGCPKKDSGGAADAADEAAPVAVAAVDAAPVAPTAKNASDIARFGTETAINNEVSKTLAGFTQARTSPRAGNVVATLKPGTDVTKIASHNDTFLVTFADPKDAQSVLMGWIGKEAFTLTIVDAGHDANRTLVCAAGTIAVFLGGDAICKKRCNADKDCKGSVVGSCIIAAQLAAGGRAIHVCSNDP